MFKNTIFVATLVITVPFLCGCTSNSYDLELKPIGENIDRKLSYKNSGPTTDKKGNVVMDEEAIQIGTTYGSEPELVDGQFNFQKVFKKDLPSDIGGHGKYRSWQTPLGSANIYAERIRGSIDLATQLNNRRIATDKFLDVVIGWLEKELGELNSFEQVRTHFDKQIRNDLQNLSIYMWQLGFDANDQLDFTFRLGQFLVEREYMKLDDIAVIARQLQKQSTPPLLVERFSQLVTAQLNIQELTEKTDKLNFLANQESLKNSFTSYVNEQVKSGELKLHMSELEIAATDQTPERIMSNLAAAAFMPNINLFGSDNLTAKIHLPVEPIYTNGIWDPQNQVATWKQGINYRDSVGIPDFLYAAWVAPDHAKQKKHFGKTILNGKRLVDFAFWYAGLNKLEQKKWNDFLNQLSEGPALVSRLTEFANNEGGYLNKGASVLINALNVKEESE